MGNLAYKYDEIPYEILDGVKIYMLARPSTNHNTVILNLSMIFGPFLKNKKCKAFFDGVDVYLTENDIVIPDFMVVCNRNIINKKGIYGAPDLIVEVLSPGTEKNDRGYKKNLYQQCGVKEYWIIDSEKRSIEVYLLTDGQYELKDVYIIYPDYELESMTEEEKGQIITKFKTSLYDDLIVSLDDVFDDMLF